MPCTAIMSAPDTAWPAEQAPVVLNADGAGFEGPAAAGALGAAAAALAAGIVVAAGSAACAATTALPSPLARRLVDDHLQKIAAGVRD